MQLLTKALKAKLVANRKKLSQDPEAKLKPVVKFFTPWANCTWLITEITNDNLLFGLCDLGLGFPELGYVSLDELESVRSPLGLKIERDLHFEAKMTLSEYTDLAMTQQYIAA